MGALARNSLNQSEAVVRRCSVKNVFLEISQNSQEKTCARVSFLIKLQAFCLITFKKSVHENWKKLKVADKEFHLYYGLYTFDVVRYKLQAINIY